MSNAICLVETPTPQPPTYGRPPRYVNPTYVLLLLVVLATGTASTLAWYLGEFSLENRASKGVPAAQYLLGKNYFDTAISWRDYTRAARLIRAAAEQGYPKAQAALGLLCEHGLGVPKSNDEAIKWFGRSANQGFDLAQNELGVMWAQGRGVRRNLDQAIHWFQLAAAQGSDIARRNLYLAKIARAKVIPQLTTASKHSYKHVLLQKVESDGITVSFSPNRGGFGLAKLRLENLPSDLQELCKYATKEGCASGSAFSQMAVISNTL
jgi:TPR repeat protein